MQLRVPVHFVCRSMSFSLFSDFLIFTHQKGGTKIHDDYGIEGSQMSEIG